MTKPTNRTGVTMSEDKETKGIKTPGDKDVKDEGVTGGTTATSDGVKGSETPTTSDAKAAVDDGKSDAKPHKAKHFRKDKDTKDEAAKDDGSSPHDDDAATDAKDAKPVDDEKPHKLTAEERRAKKAAKRAAKAEQKRREQHGKGYGNAKVAKKGSGQKSKGHGIAVGIVVVVMVFLAVLFSGQGVMGLFSGVEEAANQSWEKTGKVAATVMGDNVMEDTITEQIMDTRGSKSDKKWAQYLVDNDETPSSLRESTISTYEETIILKHAMQDNGLSYTLTDKDVSAWWKENKSTYEQYGITKDTAKSYYASEIRQWALEQKVTPKKSITDKEVLAYINKNASKYNGARKSSHILFSLDSNGKTTNKDKAEKVLKEIQTGQISFDKAVTKYSKDTGSAKDNGNVGWDCDTSFVDAYENALKKLDKGKMTTELVQSDYGYHIIKCTDVLQWKGKLTDIDKVPDEIVDSIRTELQSEKFQSWYQKYQSKAKVKVNKMPKNLPYDVSLKGVKKSANANNSGTVGTSVVTTNVNGSDNANTSSNENANGK